MAQKRRFFFLWFSYKDYHSRNEHRQLFDSVIEAKAFIEEWRKLKPKKKEKKLKYTEYV